MVQLVPMTSKEFEAYLERGVEEYAEERVRAGYWTQAEAVARSRKEHRLLLPQGLKSKYHHLYMIRDPQEAEAVGLLWFKTELDSSRGSAYIFDIHIFDPFRRKGYGREAMLELENVARGMGLRQIGLHVFAHNRAARLLYERLGYSVASLNLLKEI